MNGEKKLYDVVICEDATDKIVSIIGTNLDEAAMEHRIDNGLRRINVSLYHVKEVAAGTAKLGSVA